MIHYMTTQGVGDAWVGNELRMVTKAGIPVRLHALNRPASTYFTAADIDALNRATNVIYPLSPLRALGAALAAPIRFGPRALAALWNALTGERESLRVRLTGIWHYAVACHWAAARRGEEVHHIHSQWIHSGGTVAMYGAWLLGRPFSFTGHAADLFRNRAALADKIRRAKFIICISEFHRQFFLKNGARPEQLAIAYCGIDTRHFTPRRRTRAEGEPLHILSSGRLVEKKGFPVLIEACALLRARGYDFRCTIAGSGPDEATLRAQIAAAGLDDRISLTGQALKQEDIPEFMYSGDLYCLPCVWAKDNDVDGLPQMLMEAMACGLPAVSTQLVGIPDLVIDGETGLLVPPEDAAALADALVRLGDSPELARQLAEAGHIHVTKSFDIDSCLDPLLSRFGTALEQPL
ncbi:colanic acid biosynthesis glycosyltransferase WcaL [Seohaeicola zhoushanensis]|uniref:Colanic acid biosynthesis glycosyltransferase WcaL n=2 Tax=Seohaeicola zhoushanensis TaxID=1569283 RepID=A0A8J3MCK6_9RHOB|nr:colanic acid biosynthesis glycosyltransferase WcaL [Seohaeicola zhoushanensis]